MALAPKMCWGKCCAFSSEFTEDEEQIKIYVELKMANATCHSDKRMDSLIKKLLREDLNLLIEDRQGFDILPQQKQQRIADQPTMRHHDERSVCKSSKYIKQNPPLNFRYHRPCILSINAVWIPASTIQQQKKSPKMGSHNFQTNSKMSPNFTKIQKRNG